MSLAVANDFAFPNEDIRQGTIRKTTFDLAKTGFAGSGERSERSDAAKRKNIDDRFRSLMLTQIHLRLSASLTQQRRMSSSSSSSTSTDPLFRFEPTLKRRRGSFIRVLIWLPIKPNIPPNRDF